MSWMMFVVYLAIGLAYISRGITFEKGVPVRDTIINLTFALFIWLLWPFMALSEISGEARIRKEK